jgi:hypothetical protein
MANGGAAEDVGKGVTGIVGTGGTIGPVGITGMIGPQVPESQVEGPGRMGTSQQDPRSVGYDVVEKIFRRRDVPVQFDVLVQPQASPRPAANARRSKGARTIS